MENLISHRFPSSEVSRCHSPDPAAAAPSPACRAAPLSFPRAGLGHHGRQLCPTRVSEGDGHRSPHSRQPGLSTQGSIRRPGLWERSQPRSAPHSTALQQRGASGSGGTHVPQQGKACCPGPEATSISSVCKESEGVHEIKL